MKCQWFTDIIADFGECVAQFLSEFFVFAVFVVFCCFVFAISAFVAPVVIDKLVIVYLPIYMEEV